ncbi:uncharacterized protein LOC111268933 isoform X1 [Varroa jacobsoni]|uniref:uncharacterized protein LOC111268933 isoform X1 n=1 Tax=Varroa jacobsoni TaxID=62625 RepID=UPI000BF5BBB7|nr:uncharacterized protein LOC111268933 isoform X1 [Varroa jacobsoni]
MGEKLEATYYVIFAGRSSGARYRTTLSKSYVILCKLDGISHSVIYKPSEFHWICNNDEAVRTIAENLPPPSLGQLKAIDVNGLVCTYLTHSAIVNQVLRYFYASIAADASLTRPGYTIWNLFAQFVANRVKVLQAFNAAANSSPQEATRWTVRNEEALVDLKQAFLRSRRQLQGLQGFHW